MSSIISSMIAMLYGRPECRVLMLGLDAAGKTTILYKLKLGEVVTTIPTIGFNVETVESHGITFTVWDVGGCDKIRPLWRHYYQNTDAVIITVDSNDRDRMREDHGNSLMELIHSVLKEDELKNALVLFYFNKQDLPNAAKPAEIIDKLELNKLTHKWFYQTCVAPTGDGLWEGLNWLQRELQDRKKIQAKIAASDPSAVVKKETKPLTPEEEQAKRLETLLVEWLEREDNEDDAFVASLEDYTLDNWDHRTHLRIAWLMLTRHGRQEGLPRVFSLIKNFIDHSPRTQRSRGTTFHETMTYFWVHMVHYAITATRLPRNDFKTFLLMNPQLANGGLFLHYYSKQRMLHDPDARTMVLLPDKLPLPSIMASVANPTADAKMGKAPPRLTPSAPLTDDQFLLHLKNKTLPGWGHDVKLRVIYLLLCRYGHNNDTVEYIMKCIGDIEGAGAHLTLTQFWIHMVHHHILSEVKTKSQKEAAVFSAFTNKAYVAPSLDGDEDSGEPTLANNTPFGTFILFSHCQPLRNQLLYEKYYSMGLIDNDALSKHKIASPNVKKLPTIASPWTAFYCM